MFSLCFHLTSFSRVGFVDKNKILPFASGFVIKTNKTQMTKTVANGSFASVGASVRAASVRGLSVVKRAVRTSNHKRLGVQNEFYLCQMPGRSTAPALSETPKDPNFGNAWKAAKLLQWGETLRVDWHFPLICIEVIICVDLPS